MVEKTVYDELAKKVNAFQATATSNFVKKMTIIQKFLKLK